jgi:hypothetical protein
LNELPSGPDAIRIGLAGAFTHHDRPLTHVPIRYAPRGIACRVKVQFSGAGTWYTATNPSGTTWSVDLSAASVSVASLTSMRVIAGAVTD